MTGQYHVNEDNNLQKPFLLIGILAGLWLGMISNSVSMLSTVTFSVLIAAVLCLALSQVIESIRGCLWIESKTHVLLCQVYKSRRTGVGCISVQKV